MLVIPGVPVRLQGINGTAKVRRLSTAHRRTIGVCKMYKTCCESGVALASSPRLRLEDEVSVLNHGCGIILAAIESC